MKKTGGIGAPMYPDGVPEHKKRCARCIYHGGLQIGGTGKITAVYCDYIGATGHRRPCPPEECTVFEPIPRGKKLAPKTKPALIKKRRDP